MTSPNKIGNETQQTKTVEIQANVPPGCTASQPILGPWGDVYVDITTPKGVAYRLSIRKNGLISRNRIIPMR